MPLKERQKSILDAVVRDYVRTARPVASLELLHEHDFGVGSATIRSEMLALDEQGFLQQPHPSAGRVPTDRGYRFFVDHLAAPEGLSVKEERLIRNVFAIRGAEEFLHAFAETVADIAGAFTAVSRERARVFYKSGFSAVLEEPEFSDPERARGFGRLADVFDWEVSRMLYHSAAEMERIWIGEENPWREARRFTMILTPWEHQAGFKGFISMIAPTRTNYPKHKAIIRFILGTHHERHTRRA